MRDSAENSSTIFIRDGEPWLMSYCWSFYFHATPQLSLCRILDAPGPAMTAYARHHLWHFWVDQQYVMRVPLATAHEKGYDGGSTTARRRSRDSSAISLPTVGPGCSEAPPSVAPPGGSTQQRFSMKRTSRAGSQHLEVHDGCDLAAVLWPRCPQKDRHSVPHHEYGGSRTHEGEPDLQYDDGR